MQARETNREFIARDGAGRCKAIEAHKHLLGAEIKDTRETKRLTCHFWVSHHNVFECARTVLTAKTAHQEMSFTVVWMSHWLDCVRTLEKRQLVITA